MGFLVTRRGGLNGDELRTYARLLRQNGKVLGNLERVPDPNDPGRWAAVWDTEEAAQEFAKRLKRESRHSDWSIQPTRSPASTGPFGPILIAITRHSDRFSFAIHHVSRHMIKEAFAKATPSASSIMVNEATWDEYQDAKGTLPDLVKEIVPLLTGLTPAELADLGYVVIEEDAYEIMVRVPPAGLAEFQCPPGLTGRRPVSAASP